MLFSDPVIVSNTLHLMRTVQYFNIGLDDVEKLEVYSTGMPIGIGSVINHMPHGNPRRNCRRYFSGPPVLLEHQIEAHTLYPTDVYETVRPVEAGEEIYQSYESEGSDEWFSWRKIVPKLDVDPTGGDVGDGGHEGGGNENQQSASGGGVPQFQTSRTVSELRKIGYCVSHTYLNSSKIQGAGRGLYAGKAFRKGEIVNLAPTLVLDWNKLSGEHHASVLENYLVAFPGSQKVGERGERPVLFPFGGNGILANHADTPNLVMQWSRWPPNVGRLMDELEDTAFESLVEAPNAPLMIAFLSTREIAVHEELTLDYGGDWGVHWKNHRDRVDSYGERVKEWATAAELGSLGLLFRRPVYAGPLLPAPSSWLPLIPRRHAAHDSKEL